MYAKPIINSDIFNNCSKLLIILGGSYAVILQNGGVGNSDQYAYGTGNTGPEPEMEHEF